jgi:hypothetical protein
MFGDGRGSTKMAEFHDESPAILCNAGSVA